MSKFHDLLSRVADEGVRNALKEEYEQATKHKKFGLVFEEHLPECTPLWGMKIRRGMLVARKDGDFNDVYQVQRIKDDVANCWHAVAKEAVDIPLCNLIPVARFGDPIYPILTPIDTVENAPDDKLWHTLIQADNYHALQLLEYLYEGKVDCIYIDPPYNTGARDWKYNNDYVDSNDAYRHSKWLSMMQKRLRVAKKLLNPKDSVLIVTIDEKEYLHLGMLLEEMFPEARIQMVTSVINPKGNRRDNQFSRCEEYLYFVYFGIAAIVPCGNDMLRECNNDKDAEDKSVRYRGLLRQASNHGRRVDRPNLFYPLLFEASTGKFLGPGRVLKKEEVRDSYIAPSGSVAMWPIASNGTELTWNLSPDTLIEKRDKHFLRFGRWDGRQRVGYYLSEGMEANFYNGLYNVLGMDDDGAYIIELKDSSAKEVRPLTVWNQTAHSASESGTSFLNQILGSGRFSFPKSLYAVHDAIRFFVANKPNALIVDFFAGSGTTLHAVNLLNAEDGGHRRCIMVTNNEVSEAEGKAFREAGINPGDDAWEAKGIAQYVTWPRTKCSINGVNVNGETLKGEYIPSKKPMADGFKTNAAFFKLEFVDKDRVALGKQFKELLPILWMKSGAKGKCPKVTLDTPPMLVLPKNEFAVLTSEAEFMEFEKQVQDSPEIKDIYLVTDSNNAFKEMSLHFKGRRCIQLYRDYLDNFRINKSGR